MKRTRSVCPSESIVADSNFSEHWSSITEAIGGYAFIVALSVLNTAAELKFAAARRRPF